MNSLAVAHRRRRYRWGFAGRLTVAVLAMLFLALLALARPAAAAPIQDEQTVCQL